MTREEIGSHSSVMIQNSDLTYSTKICRGMGLCKFGLVEVGPLKAAIESALENTGWAAHLKRRYPGGIRPHQRLRIAVAACPNGCSQPQIHDIALIAAIRPIAITETCTGCGLCVKTCREAAIFMQGSRAVTRAEDCLVCGECARSCPANAIRCEPLGFRLLLGGHMGRHPAWATELHGLCLPDRIPHMIACLVRLLICEAREGERPSQTFARLGFAYIEQHIGVKKYE